MAALNDAEANVMGLGSAIAKVPYPRFNAFSGDIDLIGQRKAQSYYRAVVNGLTPLELRVERPVPPGRTQYNIWYDFYDELPSWTWDVPQGQVMIVHV